MIVLDTNVVSEFMQPDPDGRVHAWLDELRTQEVWTAAPVVAELSLGIALLPVGAKRRLLTENFARVLDGFRERILPFATPDAIEYGRIVAGRRAAGRPISIGDAQIAAIAVRADAVIATRNVRDFEGTGARVVNPWLPEEER
ncbi:type II toxin-antitoxin system VapC family toxin [Microbacterium bovistercoris]|uniref:Ribonuclease VapC n=1 Tax=Microbacterium bovistercoris TaxID=2293570 RepID=A0A371NTY7_9MICO|nr:type II toxin-antitoxin system VapC family toxin [Microbacterium bovistercoris]REJ05113.1 type II toxin-antitoxin system VapC family toxin [Microbacterium bovistercoris]